MAEEFLLPQSHADFTYKLYLPHPALRPFVRCYWILRGGAERGKPELMIPDGYVDLIFNYGQSYRRAEFAPELKWLEITSSHIVGGRKNSVLVENSANVDLVGVKLNPYGLWALTQLRSAEFFRQIVPLRLLAPFLGELERRIFDAPEDGGKISVLESFLSGRLLPFTNKHPEVQNASRMIVNAGGNMSIKTLGETINLPYKQLERTFERFIGMPPKSFARIIRFKKLLQSIKRNPGDHTHRYLDFGYYDQTHFIKEFKSFMGTTPAVYAGREFHAEDKFFSLGAENNITAWLSSLAKQ
jgi:AraC-like DNA-binding protein